MNTNKNVTFDGGYDCDYLTKSGNTAVKGNVKVTNGKVTVKDLKIKQ